jgi:group II intron reverse transcriptase/maturase/CRISPR-associated protein Cas4
MPELFEHITATENLDAAWEKVADSAGAPGIDNVTIDDFSKRLDRNLTTLRDQLLAGGYHPLPVKRIYVGKRNGGLRPIGIPAVRDRIAQAAVTLALTDILEPTFETCSYAYRPGRSWPDAVDAVCDLRDCGYRHVLRADIDAFFDTLSHTILMRKLRAHTRDAHTLALIRSWLEVPACAGGRLLPNPMGVHQGAVISPLLSNLYLDGFDKRMRAADHHLVRFADDFVVLCESEEQCITARDDAAVALQQVALALEPTKTQITTFDAGFTYLGTTFKGDGCELPEGARGGYPTVSSAEPPRPLPRERMMPVWQDGLLPLSSLGEYAVCPRAPALRLLTGEDLRSPEMAAGRRAHNQRLANTSPDAAVTISVPVVAPGLGVQGIVDALEEKWGMLVPVEFRWSWSEELDDASRVRLCAAAMALEELRGSTVSFGYVEFLPSGERIGVEMGESLRAQVRETIAGLREVIETWELPRPVCDDRCGVCAMRPACLPDESAAFVEELERMVGGR